MYLSVVLPCYKEAGNLPAMLEALQKTLDAVPGNTEILAVDDGSPDNTYQTLLDLKPRYKNLHIVRFARNFGKEAALTCGLRLAKGEVVAMLDADLQHPPETILEMIEKWKGGDQIVYALRRNRAGDSALRKFFTRIFYFVFRHISDLNLPQGAGDFMLLDRKVVDAINLLPEKNRFMKGLMTWVGFKRGFVSFDVHERAGGESSFRLKKLFLLALDAITSFSNLPLRVWSSCGVLVSLVSLGYFAYLLVRTLLFGVDVPGFPSIMCAILFMGGVQLISLGVIGEYIGRIFHEVKNRPVYIISDDVPPG